MASVLLNQAWLNIMAEYLEKHNSLVDTKYSHYLNYDIQKEPVSFSNVPFKISGSILNPFSFLP